MILFDFLPKESAITGEYYANLLDQMTIEIREKWCNKFSKGVLLHQDNATSTTARFQLMLRAKRIWNNITSHLFADLEPSLLLFPDLKKTTNKQTKKKKKTISMDAISASLKKSRHRLKSRLTQSAPSSSILEWWHWNIVGSYHAGGCLHGEKEDMILDRRKTGWLLID